MTNPEHITNSPSRAQELANFAREEVEKFRAGEIDRISTNEDLKARFGYADSSSFYPTLRKAGLIEERRIIKQQGGQMRERQEGVFPSREWAWMVGILAGGGHVNTTYGAITLTSPDGNFLNAYKSMGEKLFSTNATSSAIRTQKDGREYKAVKFFDRNIARRLGDLRRTEWYSTVPDKHKWILENPRYTWSFLEGFFEMRGGILKPSQGIMFCSYYLEVTNAISELLVRVGVNRPMVLHSNSAKEGVRGVGIFRGEDVKLFANNIHSKIPEKEEALEVLRKTFKASKGHTKVSANEDVVKEWMGLKETLKRVPTSNDIRRMKREGKTKYSVDVYLNRFGVGKRSFNRARENLERLAEERGRDETEIELKSTEEVQIFPPEN